ncbi:MAG: ABC transporter substrate-binding protein, partial [Chitinophagales bacterium]
MFKNVLYLTAICISLIAVSCKGNRGGSSNETYKDQVVLHTLSDFKGLNPVTSSDAQAQAALKNVYQGLLDYNFENLKLIPVLATEVPQMVQKNGGVEVTYEIRPEAVWDNGTPVTADDYIFSLKACIVPKVVNEHISSLEDVVDVIKDPTNNKKFTVVFNKTSTQVLDASGSDVRLMPEYVFDPKGVLKKYTIAQLQLANSPAENDPAIIEFANFFNGEKANRDPKFVDGSGAYKLESWVTDQRIVLVKKDNWWG